MIRSLLGLVASLLDLYKLVIIAYVVISVLHIPANKWTELLRSAVEPLLAPIRKLLGQYLPRKWHVLDWSPAALFLLVCILQWLI